MNVVLSAEIEKLVKEKIQSGRYKTAEAVVEEALQLLKERDQAEGRLEALLEEAEDGGAPAEMTEEEWASIEREGRARLSGRKPV